MAISHKKAVTHNDKVSAAHFNYLAVYFLCSFPASEETIKTRTERIFCSACTHKTQILWSCQISVYQAFSCLLCQRFCS